MTKRKYLVFSNDVAPARSGLYQREFLVNKKCRWLWALYSDSTWYCALNDSRIAAAYASPSAYQTGDKSEFSTLRWRGLAEKPNE